MSRHASRVSGVFFLVAMGLPGQVLTTLHNFTGTDGQVATALVQGIDGNLYGTTNKGGMYGYGTVFKVTTSGTFTTLYNFCAQSGCPDGEYPAAGLAPAMDGTLYGTTSAGGANGHGTVFQITSSGTLTTTHSFCSPSGCSDGATPYAPLTRGFNGEFYGTTYSDTIFKISPSGVLTTLYSFCGNCPTGGNPDAGMIQGFDGNFYGTTYGGGEFFCYQGCGTIFKITPGGTFTSLYSFCASSSTCTDGENPMAGLVQAVNGNFYGTSYWGGFNQYGTAFEITPSGSFTLLHSFCSQGCSDGYHPAALTLASNGYLYGATQFAGANIGGTIFSMNEGGGLSTLYNFCSQSGCPDGQNPIAAPVQDTDGNFYGTTTSGGASNYGTIFKLSAGLGPFVTTLPIAGKVGASVEILGTNLTGATGVAFNGTAATFKVVSSSLIVATVPSGVTHGRVKVATPSGILTSNFAFRVLP